MTTLTLEKGKERLEKNLDENLKILRILYSMSSLLAMRELILGFRITQTEIAHVSILYMFGALVLVVLGVRFFWGVGNVRRFLLEDMARYFSAKTAGALKQEIDYTRLKSEVLHRSIYLRVMLWDVSMLLAQSFVFFLLCQLLPLVVHGNGSSKPFDRLNDFVVLYCGLILMNAFWLATLSSQGSPARPEAVWGRINIVTAVIGLLSLPLKPYIGSEPYLWFLLLLFFASSVYDFYRTGWVYLVSDPG